MNEGRIRLAQDLLEILSDRYFLWTLDGIFTKERVHDDKTTAYCWLTRNYKDAQSLLCAAKTLLEEGLQG